MDDKDSHIFTINHQLQPLKGTLVIFTFEIKHLLEAICGILVLIMFYYNSENKMPAEQVAGLACTSQIFSVPRFWKQTGLSL